jgi:hypothetical protein
MKKYTFIIKKWLVRGLVVIGALVGVTACQHSCKKSHNSDADESLSSTAASEKSDVSVVEDVYGPPIEDIEEVEVVYGPPSYFEDKEADPVIIDEPQTSEDDKKVK